MSKRIILAMTFIIAMSAIADAQTSNQAVVQVTKAEQEIQEFQRELADAQARRDRAALERLIADGFTFIHSTGSIETKKEFIDRTMAGGYLSQREGEVLDKQLRVYDGHTAVGTTLSIVRIKEQNVEKQLRSKQVAAKVGGRWQLLSIQSTPLPVRPKGIAVNARLLNDYVGQYEVSSDRTYIVTKESDTLIGELVVQGKGLREDELIPRSETEFIRFNQDDDYGDAQIIFIKGENGRVIQAAFHRNGQEIWRAKKIK